MTLVNQTKKYPTRKISAVIVSGIIIGVLQSLLRLYWPDHPFTPYIEDLDIWLQGFVMITAGYFTREREEKK